jgi:hypothetical protein
MIGVCMTYAEQAVYKGIEASCYVRRPDLLVKRLKKAEVLPNDDTVRVEVEHFPPGNMTRCAIYGITWGDLVQREEAIRRAVLESAMDAEEGDYGLSPLTRDETMSWLNFGVGLAYVSRPDLIKKDALAKRASEILGTSPVFNMLVRSSAPELYQIFSLIGEL